MKNISATFRIALSLVCILSCLLLAGKWLGLIPDDRVAKLRGRSDLCEAVAINCSLLATQNEITTMEASLRGIAQRNHDVLSMAVRRSDGEMLAEIGDHKSHWQTEAGASDSQMFVPVYSGKKQWGSVEIRFPSLSKGLLSWVLSDSATTLIVFVLASGMLAFYAYLRIVLKQLNPSKVVPQRVRHALDSLSEGLIIMDKSEQIVLANQAFAQLSGKDQDELVGQNASSLAWDQSSESTQEQEQQESALPWTNVLTSGSMEQGSMVGFHSIDERRTLRVNSSPIFDADGNQKGALASFEDVTPLQKKQSELRKMVQQLKESSEEINEQNVELKRLATVDPLTNCLNRRSFFETFDTLWGNAKLDKKPLSAIMVDIDHFKSINDDHGHSAGDEVLVGVGQVLQEYSRDGDIVCRYGGEEFSVLLPFTDIDDAWGVAETIRQAFQARKFANLSITASLGVSSIRFGAPDPQQMLDQADQCLYVAKRNGRNQVVRFDDVPDDLEVDESSISREKPADPESEDRGISIPFHAVTALISALSYRDQMTGAHSRRVADLAVAVAEGYLSISECYILEIGALLHDIGKVGVPDAILLKPGKLTAEEWEVMEKHDRIGIEIIRASFDCPELTTIVANHHAFYGMSKNGLPVGEKIPVAARILAIADAYDSITSDRIYRKGRSPEEAFAELKRCAPSQFDPQLVERFIDIIERRNRSAQTSLSNVSKEAALQIGMQMERLAQSLDAQDLETLNTLADRLHQTAVQGNIPELATQAETLQHKILSDSDILEVFASANDLMQSCRETQRTYISAHTPGAATNNTEELATV